MSGSYIASLEAGKQPGEELAARIATTFEVDPEQLFIIAGIIDCAALRQIAAQRRRIAALFRALPQMSAAALDALEQELDQYQIGLPPRSE